MIPSLLGMGTWGMGGKYERDESTIDASLEILAMGLTLGIRFIDTAELYGAGLCEELVGRAIKAVPREEVSVTTKIWRTHMQYDDVLRAAEGSLVRLDTPYIDLYLIHWPNREVPMKETLRAMVRLREEGTVKAIGVSNFSTAQLEEATQILTETPAVNQIEYNLRNQATAQDVIPYCKKTGIRVIAYRPLEQGRLDVKSQPTLAALAQKYARTPNQIALNWVMAQEIIAISATMNPEHMRENAGVRDFTITPEDVELLCNR